MNYRSIAELNDDVVAWSRRLPPDLDLVVGVPRSGLLVANLLALHLNMPMTDVDGLIAGRLIGAGRRLDRVAAPGGGRALRVLVVDDSLWSGRQMGKVRDRVAAAGLPHSVRYGAVYVIPRAVDLVDFHFRKLSLPRVFEWNVLHHPSLCESCMAADGVLWPAEEGQCATGRPLFAPTRIIGTLVAAQPETMRPRIEAWLACHGIGYRELVLVPPPEPRFGRDRRAVILEKAALYRRRDAWLFVEASEEDAAGLAEAVGRPVYSAATRRMVYPGRPGEVRHTARVRDRLVWRGRDTLGRIRGKVHAICRKTGFAGGLLFIF